MTAAADWAAAFDRLDPTISVKKFINLGIRPALIPVLISFLSNRKMIVKFQGAASQPKSLIGGSPQGTILAGIQYIISDNGSKRDIIYSEHRDF